MFILLLSSNAKVKAAVTGTTGKFWGHPILPGNRVGSIFLTGHLSCQIEHHLYPDMPALHYLTVAPQVQAIAKKYGIAYNSGSFYASTLPWLGVSSEVLVPWR